MEIDNDKTLRFVPNFGGRCALCDWVNDDNVYDRQLEEIHCFRCYSAIRRVVKDWELEDEYKERWDDEP
jgi:hypothetical protein